MKCKCINLENNKEKMKFIEEKLKEGFVLLFVWGTLQRDYGNHYLIEMSNPAYYLGKAETLKKFCRTGFITTFDCDKEKCKLMEGNFNNIKGELYLVDKKTFRTYIDKLEGYKNEKEHWYNRKKFEVKLNNGLVVEAWMYYFECDKGIFYYY